MLLTNQTDIIQSNQSVVQSIHPLFLSIFFFIHHFRFLIQNNKSPFVLKKLGLILDLHVVSHTSADLMFPVYLKLF